MSDTVSLVIALPAWTLWVAVGAAYPIVGAIVVWMLRWWGCLKQKNVYKPPEIPAEWASLLAAIGWPIVVAFWLIVGVACFLGYPFYVLANLGRKG